MSSFCRNQKKKKKEAKAANKVWLAAAPDCVLYLMETQSKLFVQGMASSLTKAECCVSSAVLLLSSHTVWESPRCPDLTDGNTRFNLDSCANVLSRLCNSFAGELKAMPCSRGVGGGGDRGILRIVLKWKRDFFFLLSHFPLVAQFNPNVW